MGHIDPVPERPTTDYLLMVIRMQGEQLAELAAIMTRMSEQVVANARELADLRALVDGSQERTKN